MRLECLKDVISMSTETATSKPPTQWEASPKRAEELWQALGPGSPYRARSNFVLLCEKMSGTHTENIFPTKSLLLLNINRKERVWGWGSDYLL